MTKIINEYNGKLYVTDNDNLLASVLEDLTNNNTAFPNVVDLYEYTKNVKVEQKSKNEKGEIVITKTKIPKQALRVYFADDTWTDVVKSDDDVYDPINAVLYAIVKRLMGKPTEGGYVTGHGFMSRLKNMTKHIRSEKTDAEDKEKRIKAKEESDKKAHEEAVKRREKNPSLGIRVSKLENKIEKLVDALLAKNT